MTQEKIRLLLRDLSGRLPYKVIVQVVYKDGEGWKTEDGEVLGVYANEQVYIDGVYTDIENIKPYLRPMSSMTEEEINEFEKITDNLLDNGISEEIWNTVIDWLNAHHFDHRHLIPKGLALEAPEEMYN